MILVETTNRLNGLVIGSGPCEFGLSAAAMTDHAGPQCSAASKALHVPVPSVT